MSSKGIHRPWDSDAFQRSAPCKGSSPNCRNRLRDSDACQRTALCKGTSPNGRDRLRDSDAFQRSAFFKGTVSNGCDRLRDSDVFQRNAPCKGMSFNGRHRPGDSNACQITASCKGTFSNGCHRLRDCHPDQLMAIFEGSGRNLHQGGGDVHLEKALCIDCLFCCSFNFIFGVNNCHFKFIIQQPCSLECLRIALHQCSTNQDFCFHLDLHVSFHGASSSILEWYLLASLERWEHHLLRCSLSVHGACPPWLQELQWEFPYVPVPIFYCTHTLLLRGICINLSAHAACLDMPWHHVASINTTTSKDSLHQTFWNDLHRWKVAWNLNIAQVKHLILQGVLLLSISLNHDWSHGDLRSKAITNQQNSHDIFFGDVRFLRSCKRRKQKWRLYTFTWPAQ